MSKPQITSITIPDLNGKLFTEDAISVGIHSERELFITKDGYTLGIRLDDWPLLREAMDQLATNMLIMKVAREGEQ